MKIQILHCSIAILLSASLLSCKREVSELIDPSFQPPYLLKARLTCTVLNLDTTTTGSVIRLSDGTFTLSDSVMATIADSSGGIRAVSFKLHDPYSHGTFSSGPLFSISTNPTTYAGTFSFTISRADVGIYIVEVYAEGESKLTSNILELPLIITRNNSRPQTARVTIPDTLIRPHSGSQSILFAIEVSDSDGYGDIDEVFFQRISPSLTDPILMFDDGNQSSSGDQLAGDGIFSRLLRIDSTARLGDQEFLFEARDKQGSFSDSLTHAIAILP